MSWKFVSAWHEPLRQALISRKGCVLAISHQKVKRPPTVGAKLLLEL
jgi:hypothetical protein